MVRYPRASATSGLADDAVPTLVLGLELRAARRTIVEGDLRPIRRQGLRGFVLRHLDPPPPRLRCVGSQSTGQTGFFAIDDTTPQTVAPSTTRFGAPIALA